MPDVLAEIDRLDGIIPVTPESVGVLVDEIRRPRIAMAAMWRPIDEAEPNQTYLLGWHDWRDHAWCTEVASAIHGQRFENGYSNVSRHGSATHFMPLPSPPAQEG